MPTYNLDLKYKIVTTTVVTDPTTDSPSVEILLLKDTKLYSIGTFSLPDLKVLTGLNTAYNALIAMIVAPPADPDAGYAVVSDSTIDNEVFVQWAERYENSSIFPFIKVLFP